MSTCFDPGILWHFFMSALKDLWKDGNSEKRFDPTQLDVTGYSLGGQATWVLWSFYGSCLDPWLHAWELDSSAHDTTKYCDIFLCGLMLANGTSRPSHMKIIGVVLNIVVSIWERSEVE